MKMKSMSHTRKPLLYMRKKNLLGPLFCKYFGYNNHVTAPRSSYIEFNTDIWSLNFDGTNYAELSEPWTATGDFEVEVQLESSNLTNVQYIFDTAPDGLNRVVSWTDGTTGFINWGFMGGVTVKLNGVIISNNTTQIPNDGKIHTLTYSAIGGGVIGVIGTRFSLASNFIGTIYSAKLIDLDTPANSVSWELNSGPPVYEVGSELAVNGDFSDDTSNDSSVAPLVGWTNTNTHNALNKITINNDSARIISDGTSIGINQSGLIVGDTYLFSVDLISISSGIKFTNKFTIFNMGGLGIGTHTFIFTATDPVWNITRQSGSVDVTFDNASVKPYISTISDGTIYEPSEEFGTEADIMRADDWATPPTGITVSGRTATFDGTQSAWSGGEANSAELYSGLHIITYRVSGLMQGSARVNIGDSPSGIARGTDGTYTIYQNPIAPASIRAKEVGSDVDRFIGSVEIISIKPVPKGLIYQNVSELDWENI